MGNTAVVVGSTYATTISFDALVQYADGSELSQVYIVPAVESVEVDIGLRPERHAQRALIVFHSDPVILEVLAATLLSSDERVLRAPQLSSNALVLSSRELCFVAGASELVFELSGRAACVLRLRLRVRAHGYSAFPELVQRLTAELRKRENDNKALVAQFQRGEQQRLTLEESWKSLAAERERLELKVRGLLDRVASQAEKLGESESEGGAREREIRSVLLHDFGVNLPEGRLEMLLYLLEQWGKSAEEATARDREIDALRERIAFLEQFVSEITQSRSWKLTGPVRAAGQYLRRVRQFGRSRR